MAGLHPAFVCCAQSNDVTDRLEYVGDPFATYYRSAEKRYAKNIWDMVVFRNKLFLGAGNSSNKGPAVSPGRAPIIAYDLDSGTFTKVFTTDEEQVDSFYVFGDTLYVPGHDPKESWELGNIYKTQDGSTWLKRRNIPKAIHAYSLAMHNDKLFAGLGTPKGGAVAVSEDNGETWEFYQLERIGRIYNLLKVADTIYAVGPLLKHDPSLAGVKNYIPINELYEWKTGPGFILRSDLNSDTLFPNTILDPTRALKIGRTCEAGEFALYIGSYTHNDHQAIPFGLYSARSLRQNDADVNRIRLPEDMLPWDIAAVGSDVYVLANSAGKDHSVTMVLKSKDLDKWETLFKFSSPCLVRSFAYFENIFYFGCGDEIPAPDNGNAPELTPLTGAIYSLNCEGNPH